MPDPSSRLGVVVLAYNRAAFTRQTVASMIEHGTGLAEITIADNASTDETPSLAEEFGPGVRYVRFDENLNAEAVNRVWAGLPHPFLMRSDNDLIYKAGWDRRLVAVFDTRPDIGGLSPMCPSTRPPDAMAGEEPVWHLRTNATGTVAIRRSLYDGGLRWNQAFPCNDAPFSWDVKRMGYEVAAIQAAENIGFHPKAIEQYPDYYLRNFELKSARHAFGGEAERERYIRTLKRLGRLP